VPRIYGTNSTGVPRRHEKKVETEDRQLLSAISHPRQSLVAIMRAHRVVRSAQKLGLQNAPRTRFQCLHTGGGSDPLARRAGGAIGAGPLGSRRLFSQSLRVRAATAEAV
jgi:hypothetical protein